MEIGLGVLQFPAESFWSMSLPELYAAIDGVAEFNSGGEHKSEPMTRDELNELMELYPD